MKFLLRLVIYFLASIAFAQNIKVDNHTYTPQELIENVLINSNCITNVKVTNVVGGNFNGTDQSYGYFNGNGSRFPFTEGIVLSTGRLLHLEGPNNTLSDDTAPNWIGDTDLENVLNERNTTNATVIEFEFTALASQISFRYLFASEEYQKNNANTCKYSDLFGFLIRNVNQLQYTNIALVPDTQTPVKVTTVHPAIPGGCAAQNEVYFNSWNDASAPINFNGQTAILTATASTVFGETYRVKLVIADQTNYRYDSAVFLEAGSFQSEIDLGTDRLLATNNPLCETETLVLNTFQTGSATYKWLHSGTELIGETSATYQVTQTGTYTVEVTTGTCTSYGSITVEYAATPNANNTSLYACDNSNNGMARFNLTEANTAISVNAQNETFHYFINEAEAVDGSTTNRGYIQNPSAFSNETTNVVWARVENKASSNCFAIAQINLSTLMSPELKPDTTVFYCLNTHPQTMTLNAGVLNASGNNPSFQWTLNGVVLAETTENISINEVGTYGVIATFSNSCSKSRGIEVQSSNVATIETIGIKKNNSNNTVIIEVSGEGNYQFAINNFNFQNENTFYNVPSGFHTAYVTDVNGCGISEESFSIPGFPAFFTPNNDGVNDNWLPIGGNALNYANFAIKIFNRYGKFLMQVDPLIGWNGTYKGKPLRADDYWYTATLPDGTEFKGHFTLKR
ncbi:MAG: choice-of-anchor L domain-containing protein [Flavobacteriaceae bacterium]